MNKRATIKRIHVDMHAIRRNMKHGTDEPICTVQNRGKSIKGHSVTFDGPATMQQSKPLSCGARVWIETTAKITVDGNEIF